MNEETITYYIEVTSLRWVAEYSVFFIDSDESFLKNYSQLCVDAKEALRNTSNPDESFKYRAIKRIQTNIALA